MVPADDGLPTVVPQRGVVSLAQRRVAISCGDGTYRIARYAGHIMQSGGICAV